jgi:hypothetical protein
MGTVEDVVGILFAVTVLVGLAFAIRRILVWDRAERDRRARAIAANSEASSDDRTRRTRLLVLLSPLAIALGIWPFALIGWALVGWYGVAGTAVLAVVILFSLHSDTKDLQRRVDRIRSQRGQEPES